MLDEAGAWPGRWKGSGLKTRLLHPSEDWWDFRLGIHTFGFIPSDSDPGSPHWRGHYVPTSYRDLFRMLKRVDLGPDDVYVDLGCGLGRTVFAASRLGARKSIGVEIDASLARACRNNLARSRLAGRAIEFIEAPAQTFLHPETSVLFLFHPFGRGTLQAVLDGLRRAIEASPRRFRLVYFNPVFDDQLTASGFLRPVDRWEPGKGWNPTSGPYAVSFWEA